MDETFLGTWNKTSSLMFFFFIFVFKVIKTFYSGTVAIGERRPLCRIELNSEYSMDQWDFIAGAG